MSSSARPTRPATRPAAQRSTRRTRRTPLRGGEFCGELTTGKAGEVRCGELGDRRAASRARNAATSGECSGDSCRHSNAGRAAPDGARRELRCVSASKEGK